MALELALEILRQANKLHVVQEEEAALHSAAF